MYQYKAMLLNVVDGDTVDMDVDMGFNVRIKQRLRLLGINTAEINAKDAADRQLAIDAKQFVLGHISVGTTYIINTYKGDKYGRLLAEIYLSPGVTLNDLLLQNTLAVPYHSN